MVSYIPDPRIRITYGTNTLVPLAQELPEGLPIDNVGDADVARAVCLPGLDHPGFDPRLLVRLQPVVGEVLRLVLVPSKQIGQDTAQEAAIVAGLVLRAGEENDSDGLSQKLERAK